MSLPRVILDPKLGPVTCGKTAAETRINADIYRHTMQIIQRADRLGGWRALPAADIFEVEYWDLEQTKLRKGDQPPMFQGEVALVTGGLPPASEGPVFFPCSPGGAAVIGLDLNRAITGMHQRTDFLGLTCDVTDTQVLQQALQSGLRRFGGLDMLFLNAGIFPGGKRIAELDDALWRRAGGGWW